MTSTNFLLTFYAKYLDNCLAGALITNNCAAITE